MKKIIALFTAAIILFLTPTINAEEAKSLPYKDESVYAVLGLDGSVNDVYVVNALYQIEKDYGTYRSVENLSNLDILDYKEGTLTLPSYEDTFYYQGILDAPSLPWDIQIDYLLDGEPYEAKDLAGKSGELHILIKVQEGDASLRSFYDSYALQLSLALSNEVADGIEAPGATVVEAGGSKQIAYTVLPGQGADLELIAEVRNFEMSPMTINGVKMVFDFAVDTTTLTEQFTELKDAVTQLDSGAGDLLEGLSALSDGLNEYTEGLSTYAQGVKSYSNGGTRLSEGLASIATGLSQLSSQNEALKTGVLALEQATFDQVNGTIIQMGLPLPTLTKENYQTILSQDPSLAPMLAQIDQSLQLTGGLVAYMDGVSQLSTGTTELSYGLDTYIDSASTLASSANQLYLAAVEINDGLKALRDGMDEYKDGTAEFSEKTATMDQDIEDQIDSMLSSFMGNDSTLSSYASEKNSNVTSVQFFLRTSNIEITEEEVVVETVSKKLSFWEKLLKLFGLLKE